MLTAFSTALSALDADSTAVSVVGNNLANLNTSGFKANALYFRDLVSSAGAGTSGSQMFGTAPPTVIREFTQGAIQSSAGPLDAAIQGDGFFVLKDQAGITLYTRAGNLTTDTDGRLLTATGERVQGWSVDPSSGKVDTNSSIADIVVPVGSLKPPVATGNFTLDLNLNSSAGVSTTPDLSYPVKVFDAMGTAHTLTVEFTKTGANAWGYNITVPGADVGADTATSSVATGSLSFDSTGKLATPDAASPVEFTISGLADQADPLALSWNLYTGAGASRITQFAETSEVSASSQDGSAAAQLTGVSLGDGGCILAKFSDDQQTVVGQLALASIRNPGSLEAQGNNNFRVTGETATPVVGMPDTGGRGKIVGGSVEASTVDIATEFTSLIVYQRAYQANSRVVTSADQLSQETINLIH